MNAVQSFTLREAQTILRNVDRVVILTKALGQDSAGRPVEVEVTKREARDAMDWASSQSVLYGEVRGDTLYLHSQ